jgi:hypothetical protein
MAIYQSDWIKGIKQEPVCGAAGNVVNERFVITVEAGAADVIELGVLPAYATVTDAILINGAAGGTVTANVGIMSGEKGAPDDTRTVGTELFSAQSVAAAGVNRTTRATAFQIAPSNTDRSIGVKLSGTASEATYELVLSYRQ